MSDPRRREPRTIDLRAIARTVLGTLFGPPWDLLARVAWCRTQRRRLGAPGHAVIWVRGEAVPWADWGERHGYFEVQSMDGLRYLSAIGAPLAAR